MHEPNGSQVAGGRATRWTARLGLAGVSAIAAVVSYFHALAVVQAAGATAPTSYLVPFLADLVILGASAGLLDASRQRQPRPRLATVALATGIGVTLAMNVVASDPHLMPPWLVDAWPAVAFILALESLAVILRRGRGGGFPDGHKGAAPATDSHPEPPTFEVALRALLATGSQRGVARELGVDRSRVVAWAARVAPVVSDRGRGVPIQNGAGSAPATERSRDGASPAAAPAVPAAQFVNGSAHG